jgi:hypothetical protein
MKAVLTGMCFAIALGTAAFARQTPGAPATREGASQGAPAAEQITVTGCVVRESDYRRAQDAGRGGVAGTGVGAGNEFVLAEAAMAGDRPGAGAPAPTGTSGTSAAYELTGANEGQAAQFVGRRVEIMGRLKPAETGAGGPTGGPTAGAPPRGVDVTSKDLQLREIDVTSVKETTGTCGASAAPRP